MPTVAYPTGKYRVMTDLSATSGALLRRLRSSRVWTSPIETVRRKIDVARYGAPMDNAARAEMTIGCRDCDCIAKVPGAGQVHTRAGRAVQTMHNGIQVIAGGYHGDWTVRIIEGLRGHHEPQEELVFHHLLTHARPGTHMVELGAYWAYYTLWFLKSVPEGRALCVEPDPANLAVGQANADLNDMSDRITFLQGWVGGTEHDEQALIPESTGSPLKLPSLDMARVLDRVNGTPIEVLHIDAQGAEYPFLRSMADAVGQGKVRFLVMSTHHSSISGSPRTHRDCLRLVTSLGGHVLCEHSVQESFSGDGLIVASFTAADRAISLPSISRNRARNSLFPKP